MDDSPSIKEFRNHFYKLAEESRAILITSHLSPDDDSIGAILSLYLIIKKNYPSKRIEIILSAEISKRWQTFPGFEQIKWAKDLADYVADFDLVLFLDGCQYTRFSQEDRKFRGRKFKTVCLDHHASTLTDKFDLQLIRPTATSTCELIYRLFCQDQEIIDQKLAQTLLLGIIGDTGMFEYITPSTAYIYSIAERLVIAGNVNVQQFKLQLSNFSWKVFVIIQELVKNTRVHLANRWPKFTSSLLSREFVKQERFADADFSQAVDIYRLAFVMSISDIPWGVVLYPHLSGEVSISLRSQPGGVNVRLITEQMKIGGGHDQAAGGRFKDKDIPALEPEQCLKEFLEWLNNHSPILLGQPSTG